MNSSIKFSRVAALVIIGALAGAPLHGADSVNIPPADFPVAATPQLGVNLEGVVDYARSMTFVDTIKSARKFGSPAAPWDEAAPVDEHGWPTGDSGVVVMADTPVPPGDYAFSCTGKCDLKLVNTDGKVRGLTYDQKSNTTLATVQINEGAKSLFIAFTGTSGGIKNIRLLRPGYSLDTKEVFSKELLKAIAPFSALRLMDFTHTNGNDVEQWKDRPTQDDALQSSDRGVAWEYGIALANQTKKDLWINVPVRASDDYIKQLATLLNNSLDKDRVVYVEYSNEVWNGIFKQFSRNNDAARAEVAAGDKTLNDNGKDDNPYYWGWKRVSKQLLHVTDIFKQVFGADQLNKRFRPVLASQTANPFMARMQVEYIEKNYGPPAQFIYGIAGAPYFGPDEKKMPASKATVDDIIKATDINGELKDFTIAYLVLARYYRLHHLCYEGGLALGGEANLDAKIALNRDPKVTKYMNDYMNLWFGQGGEMFMYYNLAGTYGKYGTWGLTDDMRVVTPKQAALNAFAKAPSPPVTVGAPVPGLVEAGKADWHEGGKPEETKDGKAMAYIRDGNTFDYVLNVKSAGDYTVTMQSGGPTEGAAVEAIFSGTSVGMFKAPQTKDWTTYGLSQPINVTLPQGQIVLRLRVVHSGLNIQAVAFAKK